MKMQFLEALLLAENRYCFKLKFCYYNHFNPTWGGPMSMLLVICASSLHVRSSSRMIRFCEGDLWVHA